MRISDWSSDVCSSDLLGTPQSEQSIYRKLPEKGYAVRIWPARYPLREKLANYGGFLAPLLQADIDANPDLMKSIGSTLGGAPTDPARFNDIDLMERENEYRASDRKSTLLNSSHQRPSRMPSSAFKK